jgi:dipeptidyl aminopeptidase/acylaminoacyl peptidase
MDQLTMLDRKGRIVDRIGEPALHGQIALSPDENRLAAVRRDTEQNDIYVYELTGARRRTRFTLNPRANGTPVWSPDGRRIAFSSEREAGRLDLYVKGALDAGGAEELLYRAPEAPGVRPTDWSPDGRYILLWSTLGSERPQNDVVVVSVADRSSRTLIAGAGFATFSPDGRWVAYWTNKSGQGEIYVRRFDPLGTVADPPEWTVSNGARSIRPLWRGDEIFYRTREQHVAAVRVKAGIAAGAPFSAGVPEPVFPLAAQIQPWDLSKDSQRFILPMPATEAQATAYKIVMNWEAIVEH